MKKICRQYFKVKDFENKSFKEKCFSVLFCSLFLTGCGTVEQQNNQTAEENGSLKKTFYIKPFKDYQYPPESDIPYWAEQKNKVNNSQAFAYSDIRWQKFSLNNGLQIFFLPDHSLPSVNISVVIDAGKRHPDKINELLSPLVLKLLKQGTLKYPKPEFQRQSALLGMPVKYRQTSRYSLIETEFLPQDLALALELLAQQLAYIKPAENSITRITEQQLLENKLKQSSGFFLAKQLFYKNNYTVDHYFHYQQPTSRQIKSVREKQLMDFYQNYYRPNNTKIIIVGDLDTRILQQQIQNLFSGWETIDNKTSNTNTAENSIFSSATQKKIKKTISRIDVIDRKGSQQADILFGIVTAPSIMSPDVSMNEDRVSPDWVGLTIIASIVGGGPSSRLFVDLREQQGLAYSISARQLSGPYQSPFFIQTSVAHDKVVKTINGIKTHLQYLCRGKINHRELDQVKQQLIGETAFQFQTHQQRINDKIMQFEIGLPENYIIDRNNKINHMTSEQLFAISQQYLCRAHNFIIVGQQDKITSDLSREFGSYQYQKHRLPLE